MPLPLPYPSELHTLARRCVWYKTPQEALAQLPHLVAHVLTHGTLDDVLCVRRYLSDSELCALMDAAPPGIFDGRSWAYWNVMLGRPMTPLPKRVIPF